MGYQIAKTVDTHGKAIVLTTTLEHAELKRDQIHAFGRDEQIDGCAGAMYASIEPAAG
jgi:ATP-dependent Clp protease adaptor protein ClpS